MNVLVTNTRGAQSYSIIRALRPSATKIVAAVWGDNRFLAMTSPSARSRSVDRRYWIPSPVKGWRLGKISEDNTAAEEAYVTALLDICKSQNIDLVFPSWDPEIYILSKNKTRFSDLGVSIPVPDFDAVRMPLDKFLTVEAAKACGVACPEARLPRSMECLPGIARELSFPLIIKPRVTSGSHGMKVVSCLEDLCDSIEAAALPFGNFLIQEYISGGHHEVLRLVLDKQGVPVLVFCERRWRIFGRFTSKIPTVAESLPVQAYAMPLVKMMQKCGWWGPADAEFIVDPRDGIAKLLEVNPRMGGHHWHVTELGINSPLMCSKIARDEAVDPVTEYPAHTLFIDPFEDLMGFFYRIADRMLFNVRTVVFRRPALDPNNVPMTIRAVMAAYAKTYRGRKSRVISPITHNAIRDPQVAICWWFQVSTWIFGACKQLGK